MTPKPSSCEGCPARGWGDYWVPDTIVPHSEVFILLQNPGSYEEQGLRVTGRIGKNQYTTEQVEPQPLIGPTGYDCDTQWFPIGGLQRPLVSLGNTIKCRQFGGNELPQPSSRECSSIRQFCWERYGSIPPSTKLIVACGAHAAAAMGCPGTITDWRGHIIPGSNPPVLVTLHPADLVHQPKMGVACVKDWRKIPRILAGEWPKPLPPIQYYRDSEEDRQWFTTVLEKKSSVSIDTEYTLGTPGSIPQLKMVGLASASCESTLTVWWPTDHLDSFVASFRSLISQIPVVMWNAVADIPVIQEATGIGYDDYKRVDDPMLKHSLLWSELPHSLEFCASLDGVYPKLKHLMATNLALYNQGDVLETLVLNDVYDQELSQDPQTRYVYETQSLPLIPLILQSQSVGIRVNRPAVVEAITRYREVLDRANRLAREACGYEINLGSSKQVQAYLYDTKGYQVQKHFKTKRPTVNTDAINTLRSTKLPIDGEYEEKEGLTYDDILQRIQGGGDTFLEACALFSSTRGTLSTYLYGLLRAVYEEVDDNRRKKARVHLGTVGEGYFIPEGVVGYVYPQYKQHTQANGRWSITDPPMAGMPKALHHCFIPSPGEAWIKYDFKQIEPRIRACVSHDTPRLKAFQAGSDIYEATCLEMFGKYTTTLRKLGKTVELALSYGKHPRNMHHVPGIMGYGFTKQELTNAGENYLRAHPEQTRWMETHISSIHALGYSREPVGGRKRNLLGHWGDQEREGLNQPMQSGAASLTNLTILAIHGKLPHVRLVNNRFDEHWWACPLALVEPTVADMVGILSKPWTINGITMMFPVDPPNLTVIYPPEEP